MVSVSPGLIPIWVLPGSILFTSFVKVILVSRGTFSIASIAVMILVILAGARFSSIPLAYRISPVSRSITMPVSQMILGPWGQPGILLDWISHS